MDAPLSVSLLGIDWPLTVAALTGQVATVFASIVVVGLALWFGSAMFRFLTGGPSIEPDVDYDPISSRPWGGYFEPNASLDYARRADNDLDWDYTPQKETAPYWAYRASRRIQRGQ